MIACTQAASIDAMATVGCGDLVKSRLVHAQQQLAAEGFIRRVAYLDVLGICPLQLEWPVSTASEYFRVRGGNRLPLADRSAHGWLRPSVVWYIATPSQCHIPYARQLLDTDCRVAVEKPLTQHPEEIEDLLHDSARPPFPVGHQLFKRTMLDFLAACRREDLLWASAIGFDLMETKGVGARSIDDAIWDLGWHGFEAITAAFRAAGAAVRMRPESVTVAAYRPSAGERAPARFTAARIEGFVETEAGAIPFVVRVGKGLALSAKRLVFFDAAGRAVRVVPLEESGWEAHYRLLRELMTAPRPDMKLGLAETLDVVRACRVSAALAVHTAPYLLGTTPLFLRRALPCAVAFFSPSAHAQCSAFMDVHMPGGSPVMAVTGSETSCDGDS